MDAEDIDDTDEMDVDDEEYQSVRTESASMSSFVSDSSFNLTTDDVSTTARGSTTLQLAESFNISQPIEAQEEIREESILDESLSTSILEDEPLRFHYIENGSKRGGKLLVGSLGYTYGVKLNIANSEPLRRLVTYIDRQWMTHAIFDIQSWSIFGCMVRTNNDVEGWHHRLNNRAGHRGLTFYKLVPVLRKEGKLVKTITQLVSNGDGGRDIRPTYRRQDQQIQQLWDDYSAGVITTAGLLRGCAKLYGPKDN